MPVRTYAALALRIALVLALAPHVARAEEAFVVNRAEDLRFVPLRETFTQVRSRMEGHVDLMDRLRRQAFKQLSADWGIPPSDKKDVALGCVARTDASGKLSFAIVLRGDIEPLKIQAKVVDIHLKTAKRRGLTTTPETLTVKGHPATRIPPLERQVEYTLVPLDRLFVMVGASRGDQALLEEVLTALEQPDKLGQTPLGPVVVESRAKLSDSERKRVTEFQTRSVASGVRKVRDRFRQLHDKLRPGGAQDEDLKSLDERLTEQFLKAEEFQLKLTYAPAGPDLYRGKYVLNFGSPEDATRMRELMLEKVLFFRENAANPGIPRALDTVTLDAQANAVVVRVELDTPEKRYDALFSYLAFLLSFSNADRVLGIARGN